MYNKAIKGYSWSVTHKRRLGSFAWGRSVYTQHVLGESVLALTTETEKKKKSSSEFDVNIISQSFIGILMLRSFIFLFRTLSKVGRLNYCRPWENKN